MLHLPTDLYIQLWTTYLIWSVKGLAHWLVSRCLLALRSLPYLSWVPENCLTAAKFSNRTLHHKFKYHPHHLDTWHSITVRFRRNTPFHASRTCGMSYLRQCFQVDRSFFMEKDKANERAGRLIVSDYRRPRSRATPEEL